MSVGFSRMFAVLVVLLCSAAFPVFSQHAHFIEHDFSHADSLAQDCNGEALKDPGRLAENLTAGLISDVDKVRAIFRWITDNVSYDYKLYQTYLRMEHRYRHDQKRRERWEKRFANLSWAHLVNQRKTVCGGYAALFEIMCEHVGIPCRSIGGYARTLDSRIGRGRADHAWNAVKLKGQWYLCDPTWASGSVDERGRFIRHFKEEYFLTDPALFIANHFPEETSWTLLKERPTLQAYLCSPIRPGGFIKNRINQYAPETGVFKAKSKETTEFSFTSNRSYIYSSATIVVSDKRRKFMEQKAIPLTRTTSGEYVLNYQFPQRGYYEVRIYVNYELTFKYYANVKS